MRRAVLGLLSLAVVAAGCSGSRLRAGGKGQGEVVEADAVLVADGGLLVDESLANGRFEAAPTFEGGIGVGVLAEEIGGVDATASGVDVGEVGEDVNLFIFGL